MDDAVWLTVCQALEEVDEPVERCVYRLRTVLKVGLWAILQDRPFCWACEADHWPARFRPRSLPDQSTLSRRWRTDAAKRGLERLHTVLIRALGPLGRYAAIDGRPMPVGGASQDKEARAGRSVRGMGRGYKLHAMVNGAGAIVCFLVKPMNEAEQTVAQTLMRMAPPELTRIVGDAIYDSIKAHHAARQSGRKLYTPLRENRVGRRQQPERLRLLRLNTGPVGRRLLRSRDVIERAFATMSNIGIGFKGLPPWARRLHRAAAWISGKILFYNAYLLVRRERRALAA